MAPESGTQYDFETGCPCCGTGSRQVSGLFLEGKLPEQAGLIETETGEWLLSDRIAQLLTDCLNGVELLSVRARRSGDLLPWVQLLPESHYRDSRRRLVGLRVDRQCACCSRNGYFGTVTETLEPHYGTSVCASAYDAMRTWEHFGLSSLRTPRSESVLATPGLVISSRLFRGLKAQDVRGLAFIPVICEDIAPLVPDGT